MNEQEDPYLDGVKGCNQYGSCPYHLDDPLYHVWMRGYFDRKHGYVDEYGYFRDEDDE